jgi:hypothetical protein
MSDNVRESSWIIGKSASPQRFGARPLPGVGERSMIDIMENVGIVRSADRWFPSGAECHVDSVLLFPSGMGECLSERDVPHTSCCWG